MRRQGASVAKSPTPPAADKAMIRRSRILATTALAAAVLLQAFPTLACSLVFVNNNDVAKIAVQRLDIITAHRLSAA